jgi:N-succinyldiaminopimelate aminotransferase
MADRTISISSAGKTSPSPAGRSVGTGSAEQITAVNTASSSSLHLPAPVQPAGRRCAALGNDYFDGCGHVQAKRDRLCDGWPSWDSACTGAGQYFVTTDVRPLGTTTRGVLPDAADQAGVVAIPHQVFYDNVDAGARCPLAFCKQDSVIGRP